MLCQHMSASSSQTAGRYFGYPYGVEAGSVHWGKQCMVPYIQSVLQRNTHYLLRTLRNQHSQVVPAPIDRSCHDPDYPDRK